ncbi:MAG: hypothetical protein EAZ91_23960 [Cytophagales bacterium]|nr:MAG: hypothetical protein EAZ91_23960 [Cytophagales bacterium]
MLINRFKGYSTIFSFQHQSGSINPVDLPGITHNQNGCKTPYIGAKRGYRVDINQFQLITD